MHYPSAMCLEHGQVHINRPAFTLVNITASIWQCLTPGGEGGRPTLCLDWKQWVCSAVNH